MGEAFTINEIYSSVGFGLLVWVIYIIEEHSLSLLFEPTFFLLNDDGSTRFSLFDCLRN